MNPYLILLGAWFVFDGAVSATVFAKMADSAKQGTPIWYADEVVRVVRVIGGLAVVAFGVVL